MTVCHSLDWQKGWININTKLNFIEKTAEMKYLQVVMFFYCMLLVSTDTVLVWFICLMAYQLLIDNLIAKFDSFVNILIVIITIFPIFNCIFKNYSSIYQESFVCTLLWYQLFLSNTNDLQTFEWFQAFLSNIDTLIQ